MVAKKSQIMVYSMAGRTENEKSMLGKLRCACHNLHIYIRAALMSLIFHLNLIKSIHITVEWSSQHNYYERFE